MNATDPFAGFHVIHAYTRAQALEDGEFVDISQVASEVGILHPTAITSAAYELCIAWCYGDASQDEAGRAWDVVWMLQLAMRRAQGSELLYQLYVVEKPGAAARLVTLKAVCGPGDTAEPVVTVMLPEED